MKIGIPFPNVVWVQFERIQDHHKRGGSTGGGQVLGQELLRQQEVVVHVLTLQTVHEQLLAPGGGQRDQIAREFAHVKADLIH